MKGMQTEPKMIGIQYLRAVAALMIAFHHMRGQIPAYAHDLSVPWINLDGLRASAAATTSNHY